MDEITIEEKKYISSKQAAKITGYAKDYIGQLCREGRVPARLVGRSWYVLESAIQDHRFGSPADAAKEAKNPHPVPTRPTKESLTLESTWEFPRYEPFRAEALPSINRLQPEAREKLTLVGKEEVPTAPQEPLEDSWRTWFERFDHVASNEPEPVIAAEPQKQEELPEIEEEQEKEVNIPIHTIYRQIPDKFSSTEVKGYGREEQIQPTSDSGRKGGGWLQRIIQIIGVLLAITTATVAVLGTGYFDEYILSISQVRIITGISIYNK